MNDRIIILGDIYFPAQNFRTDNFLIEEKINKLFNDSVVIGNLEAPITNFNKRILKNGPSLKMDPNVVDVLKKINVYGVSLINNHIKDYTVNGIRDTIFYLQNSKINYFGIKSNSISTQTSLLIKVKDKKICFYSVCENEFSGYVGNELGANTFNGLETYNEIEELKKKCDVLVILFHGGKELYRYPTPEQQRTCKHFIDVGADLVVCQHSHCVGCQELYNGKTIVYGQGNFYFGDSSIEEYKSSMAIVMDIANNGYSLSFIPLLPVNSGNAFVQIGGDDIVSGFYSRSNELLEIGADKLYFENVLLKNDYVLYLLFQKGKIFRKVDQMLFRGRLIKNKAKRNKEYLLFLINYISCETHNEYLSKYLKTILGIKF